MRPLKRSPTATAIEITTTWPRAWFPPRPKHLITDEIHLYVAIIVLNCFFEGDSGRQHLADIWPKARESDSSRRPGRPLPPVSAECSSSSFQGNESGPEPQADEVPGHSVRLHTCLGLIECVSSPNRTDFCLLPTQLPLSGCKIHLARRPADDEARPRRAALDPCVNENPKARAHPPPPSLWEIYAQQPVPAQEVPSNVHAGDGKFTQS